MDLTLITALTGVASVAAHYADAITTYQGIYEDGQKEGNPNPIVQWLAKAPIRLLGLSPLPYVAYAALTTIYTHHDPVVTIIAGAINIVSAVIGAEAAYHNYTINKAASAKKQGK